jgi:NitT/TauT family transport system substrate-binding protein
MLIISGCNANSNISPSLEKVVVSNNGYSSNAPIYIALEEGYFEEFGINVELVSLNRSSEAIAAMIAGDIDVVPSSNNLALLNTIESVSWIKAVADRGHISSTDKCSYYSMVANKEMYNTGLVTGPEDLIEYSVRGASNGIGDYFLSLYIEPSNLTLEDVNIMELSVGAATDALIAGNLSAADLVEPRLSQVLNSGQGVKLIGMEKLVTDFQLNVLVFGKLLTEDNKDLGIKFMAGYLKGVEQYNEGKTARNLEILSQFTDIPADQLSSTCWLNINSTGEITYDTFLAYQEWLIEEGELDSVLLEELFFDSYFISEAINLVSK